MRSGSTTRKCTSSWVSSGIASCRIWRRCVAGRSRRATSSTSSSTPSGSANNRKARTAMGRPYNVIDADGHVLEPVDIWDKYIDPAYHERAPKIIVDTDGKERLLVGQQVLGSQKGFGVIGAIGSRDHEMPEDTMKYIDGRKGGFDPHARIPDMDLDGIDAAFLYPSLGLFSGAVQDPGLAAAMCRAYNRWLADYCRRCPDRLLGVDMLQRQSTPRANEEMRFARKERCMRGGLLRPT